MGNIRTEARLDKIGRGFLTDKGTTLTIQDIEESINTKGYWTGKYIFECSKCSADVEMWPYGSITASLNNVKEKRYPCGCSKAVRYTEIQYKLLIERLCNTRGYKFLGWAGGFKGKRTKLKLINLENGNFWDSTIIDNFRAGAGCPLSGIESRTEKSRIPIEDYYKRFAKILPSKVKVSKIPNETYTSIDSYWRVDCEACAQDKFSLAGISGSSFTVRGRELLKGRTGCRCTENKPYTKEELEHLILIACSDRFTFHGWASDKYTTASGVLVTCNSCGYKFTTHCKRLELGTGCRKCYEARQRKSGRFNGYDPARTEDKDMLYVIRFKDTFTKCGRAFILENRLKGSRGLLKESGCTRDQLEILHVYTGTHQEVYDTEQFVIDELTERGFYYKTWTRETFSLDSEKLMVDLIENHSTLTKVEYVEGM